MNLLLWTAHVTLDHAPLLADIKRTGFDGVEIPIFQGNAAHYQALGRELANQGLRSTAVTVVDAATNPVSPDATIRQAALDRIKWAIDMVAALGGETLCGPFHSALGVFSGSGPTPDEKQRAADVLRVAAEHAQAAKVLLAIEYLNRFECYLVTTAADARQLVDTVNHPAFRTMYDTFHANIEEKAIAPAIRTLAPVLAHVHISENDRGTPGSGHVPWAETFRTLREVGYDGWLTIEAFGRALPDLAAATKIWRDLFASPTDVYTQGLRLIREQWAAAL